MTNNHAQVGVRLINSINHIGKDKGFSPVVSFLNASWPDMEHFTIERFCMSGGEIGNLKAYMTNLYLSKDSEKVQKAIEEGKTE
ncbi:unnamed protein product [Coregonus sp. 'balchen']|nr:unnamed protein product [Coregonus sp. 'balchen']